MAVRVLHVADVHLGRAFSQVPEVAPQRQQDLLQTFDRVCTVALERDVAAVLVAGDLFDRKDPPQDLIGRVQGQIDRLASHDVRVFIIPGNHDDVWYEHSVWRRSTFGAAHVFTAATFGAPATFEVNGTPVHVHGVAYSRPACPAPLHTLQRDAPGIHIGLLHATVDPPAHFPEMQRFFPLTTLALAQAGLDYVALGHIHRRQEITWGGRSIGWYPGSPEGLDRTETGPRYVALVEFGGAAPRVEMIRVNTREVRSERLDVSDLGQEDIVQALRARARRDDLVTTDLTGCPREMIDCASLKERLDGDFFCLALHDETRMLDSEVTERWLARQNTIGGRFVRRLHDRIVSTDDDGDRAVLELALKMGLLSLEKRRA
ncbi:MAG: DNA repair exonuclease [Chloroflexota bacterium]